MAGDATFVPLQGTEVTVVTERFTQSPVKTSHGYCAQERMAMIIFSRCQDSADSWVLGYTCSGFDAIMISQHSFASNSDEKYYKKVVFYILF